MKKLISILALFSLLCSYSCEKNSEVPSSMIEAELRLSRTKFWVISDATKDGVYLVKDKVVLDKDAITTIEYIKFDNDEKTMEVLDEGQNIPEIYKYRIEGNNFIIYEDGNQGDEEVYTIKSGSISDNHFTLSFEDDGSYEIKMVPKK
jgi:hypothetical protein